MTRAARVRHLVRRTFGSLSNRPLDDSQRERVESILLPGEMEVWSRLPPRDQRHSLDVLDVFIGRGNPTTRDEEAAALLHDVGKVASMLGIPGRILATILGPRTRRWSAYLEHERIGVDLMTGVSTPRTISLLDGTAADDVLRRLRVADDS